MKSSCKRLFVLLTLLSIFKTIYLQKRPPHNFPFHGPLKNQDPAPPRRDSQELSICSRCNNMFRLSEREFKTSNNVKKFCIRLLQVKRCIKKLRRNNSFCHGIGVMALDTGVFLKMRLHRCRPMDVSANDLENIFRSDENKIIARPVDKCRYLQTNTTLSEPAHCGMFGDPHLRTFYNEKQTCVVAGAWSLLDNQFIAVQVTNELVQHTQSTSATATSKISIIFKETNTACNNQKIYEATSTNLPNVFKDGTSFSGPPTCRTKVLKENTDQIYIRSCYSNTTIIIRRIGKYLTFNMQTPHEFVNKSSGLCRSGCPMSELVDYNSFFQNKMNEVPLSSNSLPTATEAMKICEKANLTDFYYDSCVFDLLTTGDQQFSEAAVSAMSDAQSLDPKIRLRRENSVVLNAINSNTKRSARSTGRTLCTKTSNLLIFMVVMLVNHLSR